MANKNKSGLMVSLLILVIGVMVIPLITSCGKSEGITSTNNNARLLIVNASPDVLPIQIYGRFIPQGSATYRYPSASNYTLINVADSPIQVRNPQTSNNQNPVNLLTLSKGLIRSTPYTLFVMGLKRDSSLAAVVTVDTTATPANGRGKIRLVNAMANVASGVNLTLNGTPAFTKVPFKGVTNFIEVTSGTYNINVVANNDPTVVLKGLTNFNVSDGKSYTIYSYGLSSASNDSTVYGVNSILNTLPLNSRY